MYFGIGGEQVTVWDEERNKFGDENYINERTVYGCVFAPMSSDESGNQRNATVTTGLKMYAPYGSRLTAQSRIRRQDGSMWDVDGDPGVFLNPIGNTPEGEQAQLKRVTG